VIDPCFVAFSILLVAVGLTAFGGGNARLQELARAARSAESCLTP